MIALSGHLLILLALVAAVAGAVAASLGNDTGALWARRAAFVVFALVALAVAVMELALVTHDFSVKYVATIGSRETSLFYTVVSLWGALEGSILFWTFLLAGYTTVFVLLHRDRFAALQRRATGILLGLSSFFLFLTAGPSDPFAPQKPVPLDGLGPQVLLQNHPMTGLHPPLLYLGYVGLAVPFAIAIASLLGGSPTTEVLRLIRRWTLVPWVCLSLGIVAGMWWSYAVLGWGGYWAWDPVENASVMPWLVATAFLHSLQVQERRQMLKTWTLSLVISSFLLTILGTFLTRGGVLASVHSFTQSPIGPLFLAFFATLLLASLGLLFARSKEMAAPGVLESSVCRETAFLFNNLLLVAVTFTILLGTLFPLIAEALQGTQLSVGAPYFNHAAVPIGFALLFLMGVGPLLPWGAARLEDLQYRLLTPVAAGVTLVLLLLVVGIRGIGALVTFGAAAFVLAVTLGRVASDINVRRNGAHESWVISAGRLFRANPRRYSGYLAHIGVLLIVIGIAASQTYQVRQVATLRPGQAMSIGGYRLTYVGPLSRREPGRMVAEARISVGRDGVSIGTLTPSQKYFINRDTTVVTPAVREEPWDMLVGTFQGRSPLNDLRQLTRGRNPFEDLYVTLDAVVVERKTVTLQVLVNPMVGFIWLGGIIVGLGGCIALIPGRRRRRVPAQVPERVVRQPEEAVV